MTIALDVKAEGVEPLVLKFQNLEPNLLAELRPAVSDGLNMLFDTVAQYPPESDGNQPGRYSLATHEPMGYYQRGVGWWYPIVRREALGPTLGKRWGSILAPQAQRGPGMVIGYKLRAVSEQLGRSWTMLITATAQIVEGVLANRTSYGVFVQGIRQWHVHAARGWLKDSQALDLRRYEILSRLQQAVGRALKK